MVPELVMIPALVIVTPNGIVTVIPAGIVTVSPELIVTGGLEPPHVAGLFQSPLATAVKEAACASEAFVNATTKTESEKIIAN